MVIISGSIRNIPDEAWHRTERPRGNSGGELCVISVILLDVCCLRVCSMQYSYSFCACKPSHVGQTGADSLWDSWRNITPELPIASPCWLMQAARMMSQNDRRRKWLRRLELDLPWLVYLFATVWNYLCVRAFCCLSSAQGRPIGVQRTKFTFAPLNELPYPNLDHDLQLAKESGWQAAEWTWNAAKRMHSCPSTTGGEQTLKQIIMEV